MILTDTKIKNAKPLNRKRSYVTFFSDFLLRFFMTTIVMMLIKMADGVKIFITFSEVMG